MQNREIKREKMRKRENLAENHVKYNVATSSGQNYYMSVG
jgi:hypothetical protein